MSRRLIQWLAIATAVTLSLLAAFLLWPQVHKQPNTATPAQMVPHSLPEQSALVQPPVGVVRGVCGSRFSGGPVPTPGQPPATWTSPGGVYTVAVLEREGDKKVTEVKSEPTGQFEVRIRPGAYRLVVDYGVSDAFGKKTVERVVEVESGKVAEVEMFQRHLHP